MLVCSSTTTSSPSSVIQNGTARIKNKSFQLGFQTSELCTSLRKYRPFKYLITLLKMATVSKQSTIVFATIFQNYTEAPPPYQCPSILIHFTLLPLSCHIPHLCSRSLSSSPGFCSSLLKRKAHSYSISTAFGRRVHTFTF